MALVTAGRDHLVRSIILSSGLVAFNNANAHLGVGNGTTAFSAAHTDLQGASKARKAMDATYPTDPPSPVNRLTFRSTFGTADANFAWDEVAVFNQAATGTMLSRLVTALGTKTVAGTWVLTLTVDLTLA